MDSLIAAVNQFVYDSGFSILGLLKSLDIGVILGINVLTSVFKSALARTKQHLLTDQTLLLFIAILGLIAGIIFSPEMTIASIFKSAMNYAGGSVLFFMLWKHLVMRLMEKMFGNVGLVKAVKSSFVSTSPTKPVENEDKP